MSDGEFISQNEWTHERMLVKCFTPACRPPAGRQGQEGFDWLRVNGILIKLPRYNTSWVLKKSYFEIRIVMLAKAVEARGA